MFFKVVFLNSIEAVANFSGYSSFLRFTPQQLAGNIKLQLFIIHLYFRTPSEGFVTYNVLPQPRWSQRLTRYTYTFCKQVAACDLRCGLRNVKIKPLLIPKISVAPLSMFISMNPIMSDVVYS